MSAFSYPLHNAYYRHHSSPRGGLVALADDYERRAAHVRALANQHHAVYDHPEFYEPELPPHGVRRGASYVEVDPRPQRYVGGPPVQRGAYYPEAPVVVSRHVHPSGYYEDPIEVELAYEEPVEYQPRRRAISAFRPPVASYVEQEDLVATPRYRRVPTPAPVRVVASVPASPVTTVPHVRRRRVQAPPAITYEYEVTEPASATSPEYINEGYEGYSPVHVILDERYDHDPAEARIRAAADVRQQQERRRQSQQQAIRQARQDQQRLAESAIAHERGQQQQPQQQVVSEATNGLEQLFSVIGGLLPQVQNALQSRHQVQGRQEPQRSAAVTAQRPAQNSGDFDMKTLGSLLASLGLNIPSSANEGESPVPPRALAPLPTAVPSAQGADLDAFKAALASLGLSIGEPSSASSGATPAQASTKDEPQLQQPHRKRSVRFSTDGNEPTRVSIPTATQNQHAGTSAPAGYTYAAPSSAQPEALRHQGQKPRAATAPTVASAAAMAESRRRDDAAAEAQQIMHAIRLSLDPANDVKPSDVSAPSATLPPAPSESTERGRSATREQMKEQATTTEASPAVRTLPAHASTSTPAPAPVRIPVRSPSPPASKAQSPMETIEVIEARFVNLEYEFVFPEHVDFAEPSSSPIPSLLYTPANAPIRQHESDLTSLMTQLDAVDSEGQGSVRAARKELVLRIEAALENLDCAKAEAWVKQQPVAAAAKSEEPVPIADETHGVSLTNDAVETTSQDTVVVDEPAVSPGEGSPVTGGAEVAADVEVEFPAVPELVSISEPVEQSISVEVPALVAESIPSYPPSLASSSKSESEPTLTFDVDGEDTISTESSPIQVPSDFEGSESEAEETPLNKAEDVPPSMEESAQLERNTEFVML